MKTVRRASVFLWGLLAIAVVGEAVLISGLATDMPDPALMTAEVGRAAAAAMSTCLARTRQGEAACAHSAWQVSSYSGDISWQALVQRGRH